MKDIEGQDTYDELLNSRLDLLRVSLAISRSVYVSRTQQDLCRAIYKAVSLVCVHSQLSVVLYEKERNQLSCIFDSAFDTDFNRAHDQSLFRNSFSHFLCKKIEQSKQPLLLSEDLKTEFAGCAEYTVDVSYPAQWFGMPLLYGDRFIGVIACQDEESSLQISEAERENVRILSKPISEALVQKLQEEELLRNEEITKAIFSISNAVNTTENLDELYVSIHNILGKIIDTRNFRIASYDQESDYAYFPYFVDENNDTNTPYKNISNSGTLTSEVLIKERPLFFTRAGALTRSKILKKKLIGTPSELWLGVPLKTKKRVIGAIIVQSYSDPFRYTQKDADILTAVSEQVALAIDRKTEEERRRESEEINQTLFEISNAVNTVESLEELYHSIHSSLGRVLDVTNFYIAIHDEERNLVTFPYYVDAYDDFGNSHTQTLDSKSLTSSVLRSGKPLFLDAEALKEREANNLLVGQLALVWFGVPLKVRGKIIGIVVAQSYTNANLYKGRDQNLLISASDQIAIAIDKKRYEKALERSEEQLKNLSKQTEQFSLAAASMIAMRDEQAIYDGIAQAIALYSDYQQVIISFFTEDFPYREIVGYAGIDSVMVANLETYSMSRNWFSEALNEAILIGQFSYYVPHMKKHLVQGHDMALGNNTALSKNDVWHPQDSLFVRMVDQNDEFIGVISVAMSTSGRAPSAETVKPLEIFSSLCSQIIIYRKSQEELQRTKQEAEEANRELIRMNLQLEEAIAHANSMADQAYTATRTKSEFLANMSHEIRTPMNAVIGFSELMTKTELSEKQLDYIETINHSSKALLNIIDDILDYSKIEAGKLSLEKTEFSLPKYLYDLLDLFSDATRKKGIDLLLDISPDIPLFIVGDPNRLRQVLVNLVGNAVKFTENGWIKVKVELARSGENEDQLRFSITDTGLGIAEDQIEKLFDSFAQADSSTTRKFGGTGLGLSICRNIVHLMHGKIWAEKIEGAGSGFYFTATFGKTQQDRRPLFRIPEGIEGVNVAVWSRDQYYQDYLIQLLGHISVKTYGLPREDIPGNIAASDRASYPWDLLIIDSDSFEEICTIGTAKEKPVIVVSWESMEENNPVFQGFPPGLFLEKPITQSSLYKLIFKVFGRNYSLDQEWRQPGAPGPVIVSMAAELPKLSEKHLLLVEDNPINCKIAGEILANMGLLVDMASNGKEALSMLSETAYDAILMDIQMPEMDGYETTKKIREEEERQQFQSVPIIAMTAHAMKGNREKCLAVGMDDYITKPIDTQVLQSTLKKWLSSGKTDNRQVFSTIPDTLRKASDGRDILTMDGINIREGVERLGGNRKLYENLLVEFADRCRSAGKEIPEFLENKQYQKIRRTIHSIKGTAGNLSANLIFNAAEDVEKSTYHNDSLFKESKELEVMLSEMVQFEKAIELLEENRTAKLHSVTRADAGILVKKLWYLVLDSDINALECFEDIEHQLNEGPYLEALAKLKPFVSELNFDGAMTPLRELADLLGVLLDNR